MLGVHPPGVVEEEAAFRRNRLLSGEQVTECGGGRSLRVDPLGDLIELARIAQQDEARGGRRGGKRTGEGELSGFVHHQHVHRVLHVLPRPDPGRARDHADFGIFERGDRVPGTALHIEPGIGAARVRRDLDAPKRNGFPVRGSADLVQQVGDDLVALRRHPHPPVSRQQRGDDARAEVRLATARGSLDREHLPVQGDRETPGGGNEVLPGLHEGTTGGAVPRRNPPEQIERGAPRAVVRESTLGNQLAEAEQGIAHRAGGQNVHRDERPGMGLLHLLAAALQDQRVLGYPEDLARRRSRRGVADARADIDSMVLGRKPVAVEPGLFFRADLRLERQTAQRRPFLEELLGIQPAEVEELPPRRLVLPPVVVEEESQELPSLGFVRWTVGRQADAPRCSTRAAASLCSSSFSGAISTVGRLRGPISRVSSRRRSSSQWWSARVERQSSRL